MGTPGGPQEVLFLTDDGVYRLLCASRKPIARPFQKWVVKVIKEISARGSYQLIDLQKEVEEHKRKAELAIAERDRANAERDSAEGLLDVAVEVAVEFQDSAANASRLSTHSALLKAFHKKYIVYFARVKEINGKTLLKIGETSDILTRSAKHVGDYGKCELLHAIECATNQAFEKHLLHHPSIKRYRYKEPVKADGRKSNEVFLVEDDEIESFLRIAKSNLHKFQIDPESVHKDLEEFKSEIRNEIAESRKEIMESRKELNELKSIVTDFIMDQRNHPRLPEEAEEEEAEEEQPAPIAVKKKRVRAAPQEVKPAPVKKARVRVKGTGKCAGCDDPITNRAVFCADCANELRAKKFEATKEELQDLIHVQKLSYVAIGKKFGVSDNAIRKRCTALGIKNRKRGA